MGKKDQDEVDNASFTAEERERCERFQDALVKAIEGFSDEGPFNVPLVLIPMSATLAAIFKDWSISGGPGTDESVERFGQLIKYYIDRAGVIVTPNEPPEGHA